MSKTAQVESQGHWHSNRWICSYQMHPMEACRTLLTNYEHNKERDDSWGSNCAVLHWSKRVGLFQTWRLSASWEKKALLGDWWSGVPTWSGWTLLSSRPRGSNASREWKASAGKAVRVCVGAEKGGTWYGLAPTVPEIPQCPGDFTVPFLRQVWLLWQQPLRTGLKKTKTTR